MKIFQRQRGRVCPCRTYGRVVLNRSVLCCLDPVELLEKEFKKYSKTTTSDKKIAHNANHPGSCQVVVGTLHSLNPTLHVASPVAEGGGGLKVSRSLSKRMPEMMHTTISEGCE